MFHLCFKGFSRNFKDVSRELQCSFTGCLILFQGFFKSVVSRVSPGCLKDVLRVFKMLFQDYFKGFSKIFKRCVKGVSQNVFQNFQCWTNLTPLLILWYQDEKLTIHHLQYKIFFNPWISQIEACNDILGSVHVLRQQFWGVGGCEPKCWHLGGGV